MKDILWLIRKTLYNTFRSKKNIMLYLGLPLVAIFISTLIIGSAGDRTLNIGVINNDAHQMITQDVIDYLQNLENVKISFGEEAIINDGIASGKLDSAIIFPLGFSQSVRAGSPDKLQMVSIKGAVVTSYIKSLLYRYLDNVADISKTAGSNDELFTTIYSGYKSSSFKLSVVALEDNSHNRNMTNQTVGFLLMFMLFGATSLSSLIVKEKEDRTYYRLLTSPITARTYVISNVIVNLIVMIVQIVVTLLFMKFLFHIDSNIPFWEMLLVLLLFALIAIGISLVIVAFSKSSASASALQSLLISPSCLISGCFFPIDIMPATVRRISAFLPQHWLLDTFNKLQQGSSMTSLYMNLLILLAFALTFSLLAIYKFGRNNDTRIFN
jgi:ABC-2 type transport system permease protein